MLSIKDQAALAAAEICDKANLKAGNILVVGCSTSEVDGGKIGNNSNTEIGKAIFEGITQELNARGIYLAAQCCEHLNRAIIIEKAALPNYADIVNVIPQPKAGGSFATAAYNGFLEPVAVESIKADAGLDIGFTLIGMHLKSVAVPLRLNNSKIGKALLIAARTRPKFIGGIRAGYDENML